MNERFGWRRNIPRELNLSTVQKHLLMLRLRETTPRNFWRHAPIVIPVGLFPAFWMFYLERALLGPSVAGWQSALGAFVVVGMCFTILFILEHTLRAQRAREVRTALREMGHDVCVTCGYLLHLLGDSVDECPECGTPRDKMPELGRVEPSK